MAVLVEMHNTGDPGLRAEVVAVIDHALVDRRGDYLVSIVGSQANDRWEMKYRARMVLSGLVRWRVLPGSMSRTQFGLA